MKGVMNNKGQAKLLAAVAVLAMVACAFAIAMPSEDIQGADTALPEANDQGVIALTKDTVLSNGFDLTNQTLDLAGFNLTVNNTNGTSITMYNSVIIDSEKTDDSTNKIVLGTNISIISGTENKISKVTLESKLNNSYTVAVGYGPDASFENVVFAGTNPTAIYYCVGATQSNLNVKDCSFSGKYINYDANVSDGNGKVDVKNSKNVSFGLLNNSGNEMEFKVGTQIKTDDSTDVDVLFVGYEGQESTTFTVPNGEEFTCKELIPGSSDGTNALVKVEGKLSYVEKGNITIENDGGIVEITGELGLKDTINADTTIADKSYLSGNLTIPEGKTLTIAKNASLDMMYYSITVYGTLKIEGGSIDSTGSSDNSIVLMSSGSIVNNGTIGSSKPIKISNGTISDVQYVEISKVNGVSIALKRQTSTTFYDMQISGDITRVSGSTSSSIKAEGVVIAGDLGIGKYVTLTTVGGLNVSKNVTVTVSEGGSISGNLNLSNGSAVVMKGTMDGKINADTGRITVTDGTEEIEGSSYIELDGGEYGFTVSVARVSYNEDGDTVTDQRLYIGGAINNMDKNATTISADVTVSGTVFVNESLTINKFTQVIGEGTVDVSAAGSVVVYDDGDFTAGFSGAYYSIESDNGAVTGYYTTFDAAYGAIGTADDTTIEVSGNYTINGTYDLLADQNISVYEGASSTITVGENAKVSVSSDANVDDDVFAEILGLVYVEEGIGYEPAAGTKYAVMTVDENENVTYSGLKVALDNAAEGAEVNIVGEAKYNGSLTIDKNITVIVNDGQTMRVTGNLTIQEGAKLVLGQDSQLIAGTAGKESTISVYGTLDAADGNVYSAYDATTQKSATVNLYSTGTTNAVAGSIVQTTVDEKGAVTINAAVVDDAGDLTYTSVAKAIAYCEDNSGYPTSITVVGTVTEKDAITSNDIDIVIANKAKVTLGDVTLVNAKISVVGTGVYTANVSGLTGTGDDAVLSTVSVTETTAKIENKVTVNAQGENVCETTISAIAGKSTAVTAGKIVFVGDEIETSDDVTAPVKLSVSSGAELVIYNSTAEVSIKGPIDNEGTVTLKGIVTIYGKTTISGNVAVADEASLTVSDGETLVITGTLTVSGTEDKEATFTVKGTLQVGEAPEYLGASGSVSGKVILNATDNKGMVVVFDGSSVADATIMNGTEAAKSTSYTINGIAYATTYGNGKIIGINHYVKMLKDLASYKELGANADDIVWYSGETRVGDETIGTYASVSSEIEYRSVGITISVMPRITLSIDGVVWEGLINEKVLTIGTHTVSVTPYPGYSGDITVTFDGKTITDGKIVITSDMIGKDPLLSVTGNIVVDNGTVASSGDDGMGLTDYLLIILVVLIAIMAIIVALRLTRS